jgi:hypothetical protein
MVVVPWLGLWFEITLQELGEALSGGLECFARAVSNMRKVAWIGGGGEHADMDVPKSKCSCCPSVRNNNIAAAARPATTKLACQPSHPHDSLAACARRLFCCRPAIQPLSPLHHRYTKLGSISSSCLACTHPKSSLSSCATFSKRQASTRHPCRTPADPSTNNHARHPGPASYLASTNRNHYRNRPIPASIRRLCSRAPNTPQTRTTGAGTATMAAARGHAKNERRRGREVLPALLGFWRLAGGV